MIAGLDSSAARPTLDQARAARSAGVRVWGGYLPPGVGLESPWDQASFQVVKAAGLVAIGFASGNDDPHQVAATARSWDVLGCLDDESGIRAVGGWEQAWLDASGFGVYGAPRVIAAYSARFHIAALYPGFDPAATWPRSFAAPPGPLGWQWQGTHTDPATGLPVDSSWLDPWFAQQGGVPVTISCPRPDGGTDYYTVMPGGQLRHVVRNFAGLVTFTDTPPGDWSAPIACGYRDGEPFFQGLGTDAAASPFEIVDPGPGWTDPVAKP